MSLKLYTVGPESVPALLAAMQEVCDAADGERLAGPVETLEDRLHVKTAGFRALHAMGIDLDEL